MWGRGGAWVALVFGAVLMAAPAGALATLGVTIHAPAGLGVGAAYDVTGRVNTLAGQNVPEATVTIDQDGVAVGSAVTGVNGLYDVLLLAPTTPIDITLVAHASSPGSVLMGQAGPASVQVRLPPDPPTSLSASALATASTAHLAWGATADAHGAPVQSYILERSATGSGVWTRVASTTGATLTYDDASVAWGRSYDYRVSVTTFAGQSAPTAPVTLAMPAAVGASLTVGTPKVVACDDSPPCDTYPPGTSHTIGANLSVRVFWDGKLLAVGGDAMPGVVLALWSNMTTTCASCSPTSADRYQNATTFYDGSYDQTNDTFIDWHDMGLLECRTIVLATQASGASLVATGSDTYTFCRDT